MLSRHADLLQFIAQKVSKCLELRQQLAIQEAELTQLKRTWARIVTRGITSSSGSGSSPPASGAQIAYAAIPIISGLEEPLRTEVRNAFAASLKTVWLVMVGMSGAGLLSVALMRELPMQQETDETFGLEDRPQSAALDSEKGGLASVNATA